MATMDIFNAPQFSVTSLSGMVDRLPYAPTLLGSMGLFESRPVRSRTVMIDRRAGGLQLIMTSPDGAPPDVLENDDRDMVLLRTLRLAKRFTMFAYELDGIRAFGTESELQQVMVEYTHRAGRLKADMSATHEHHRLGALMGVLLDADGTTVLYDYYEDFGIAKPAVLDIDLRPTSTGLRARLGKIVREIIQGSDGAINEGTEIHALIGDDAYDALTSHPEVERTYLNWSAAADLRERKIYDSFKFGGIVWHNYRGAAGSPLSIPPNGIRFFPVGTRDVFVKAMAPYEGLGHLGTLGQDTYLINIPDRERDQWVKGEIYSYPLYMCQRPEVLRSATAQVE